MVRIEHMQMLKVMHKIWLILYLFDGIRFFVYSIYYDLSLLLFLRCSILDDLIDVIQRRKQTWCLRIIKDNNNNNNNNNYYY